MLKVNTITIILDIDVNTILIFIHDHKYGGKINSVHLFRISYYLPAYILAGFSVILEMYKYSHSTHYSHIQIKIIFYYKAVNL